MMMNHGIDRIHGIVLLAVAALGTSLAAFAADPGITVSARQRYPWNGLVDLKFTIDGTSGTKYDTSFTAKDVAGGTNLTMKTLYKSNGTAANVAKEQLLPGTYNWVWDATTDLGEGTVLDKVVVEGKTVKALDINNATYMVIDLSGGVNAASYPISYLDAAPNGGWTDEYKTTKIVLRRIGPSTYTSGNGNSVKLSKPYYIAIFECSQSQYQAITGATPSYYKGNVRPVESVSYDMIRGTSNGAKWPSSSAVDATSFMGKLRNKTGQSFDLPTRAQWECACLGGESASKALSRSLSRVYSNKSDGKGGYSGSHTKVGSYTPNAWGIYDMIGNVHEWVLDCDREFTMGGTDPVGPSCYWSDGSLCKMRVVMGEAWMSENTPPSYTISALAKGWDWSDAKNPYSNYSGTHGFRVCLPLK